VATYVRFGGNEYNCGFARDITERKRVEEALRTSENKYRYIVDNTHDIIFQMDLRGNFIFANAAAEWMTGHPLAVLMRMNMLQLAGPEYHTLLKERLRERIAGDVAEKAFEFEILHKAGHRVWVELTTTAVLSQGGGLAAIQGVARDITARKHSETALRESETHYRSLFENMLNGFAYCRMIFEQGQPQDFVYLATNGAFEKLTG